MTCTAPISINQDIRPCNLLISSDIPFPGLSVFMPQGKSGCLGYIRPSKLNGTGYADLFTDFLPIGCPICVVPVFLDMQDRKVHQVVTEIHNTRFQRLPVPLFQIRIGQLCFAFPCSGDSCTVRLQIVAHDSSLHSPGLGEIKIFFHRHN